MTEVVVVIVVVVVVVVVIDCFFSEISFSRFNLYQSLNYEKRYVYVSISKLFYICKITTYEEKTTASKYENFRLIFKSKFLSNNFNIIDFRLTIKFLSILNSNILL